MTLWITGMAGFVGQAVARSAVSEGGAFCGVGLIAGAAPPSIIADRLLAARIDPPSLESLAKRFGAPSIVIHAAGSGSVGASLADPALDFEANVQSTQILCEYLRLHHPKAKLVLVSSAAVYGAEQPNAIAETAAPHPVSPYGFNKLAAELVVRSYGRNFGLHGAIVRLFSVYGEGLRKQVLWDLCGRLRHAPATELWGTGEEQRDFIHVDDAARLLLLAGALASASVPVVNGGTGEATTMAALAAYVTGAWQRHTGEKRSIGFNGQVRTGDPVSQVANVERAVQAGFSPHMRVDKGIDRYIEWFVHSEPKKA